MEDNVHVDTGELQLLEGEVFLPGEDAIVRIPLDPERWDQIKREKGWSCVRLEGGLYVIFRLEAKKEGGLVNVGASQLVGRYIPAYKLGFSWFYGDVIVGYFAPVR